MRLGLERVTKLVEALGSPQKAYRTIHVVGTNGKSSTTRFISSLLEAQGLKVGAYVSPHLISSGRAADGRLRALHRGGVLRPGGPHPSGGGEAGADVRPGGVSDPVRGAYGRGLPLLQRAGLRRGRDRGRAGRPPGRHRGDLLRRAGDHQHRPGAHRAAGGHALGHPQGEGGGDPAEAARWSPGRWIRS